MQTKQQLETALRNADQAGDVAAARQLATALKSGQYVTELPPETTSFSPLNTLKNAPSSFATGMGDLAKGMATMAMNPIDTTVGLGGAALSGVRKFAESVGTDDLSYFDKYNIASDVADSGINYVKQGYGSVDRALNTLENDPFRFLTDVSLGLSGVGAITKVPAISKAAAAIDPINMTTNTAMVGVGKAIPKNLPANMYKSAAKFSTAKYTPEQLTKMTNTALDRDLSPSFDGVIQLQGIINDYNTQIGNMIAKAEATGKTVPAKAIYQHLAKLRKDKGGMSLSASNNLQSIDNIVRDFQQHLKSLGKKNLTPSELQSLKINTYDEINFDARRNTGTPIKEDTYKAIARGTKESIESAVPGVKNTNAELAKLYELQPALSQTANRIDKNNMLSLHDAPMLGVGSLAGPAGAAFATAVSILRKDRMTAKMARELHKLSKDASFQAFLANNPTISAAQLSAIVLGREDQD